MKDEIISAFAYDIAKKIEYLIDERTNNLEETNKYLIGKILEFRNKILLNGGLSDFSILRKFDEHFEIEKV